MFNDESGSRLTTTRLGNAALDMMTKNGLAYHNISHIKRMYDARRSPKFAGPANIPLEVDLAILFHDVVYDAKGNNEERSAQTLVGLSEFLNAEEEMLQRNLVSSSEEWFEVVEEACRLIRTTKLHDEDNLLVRLDLYDLKFPHRTVENYVALMEEYRQIHGVPEGSPINFARANKKFMLGLRDRIAILEETDPYYQGVLEGIVQTLDISNGIIKRVSG